MCGMSKRETVLCIIIVILVLCFCFALSSKDTTTKRETSSVIEEVSHIEKKGFYTGHEYQDKKTGVCFYEVKGISSSITFQLYNADGTVKTDSDKGLKQIGNEMGYYIFEDMDTGVQYVISEDLSSCFERQNADGSFYIEEEE